MNNNKLKKSIAIIFIVVVFTCLGATMYLRDGYLRTRPEKAQPELGRVCPMNEHGQIVYLTREEDSQLSWLFYFAVLFIVITMGYNYRFKPFAKSGSNRFGNLTSGSS
jgi:hypothetical protein